VPDVVPGTEAVRVEDLHKSFGAVEVLKGIELSVAAHEVVCLIGASGSGKSTLLRCMNLLEPIDAGRIFLWGEDISGQGQVDENLVRRQVGIVFQSFNLFPHMNVLANVTLAPTKALAVAARRPRRRRGRSLPASGSSTRSSTTLTASRVASSSGWRSCGPWRCARGSCCSTR